MTINQSAFDVAIHSVKTDEIEDCTRIASVALQKFEIRMTLGQARIVWKSHSANLCAQWIDVGTCSDETIAEAVGEFVRRRISSWIGERE